MAAMKGDRASRGKVRSVVVQALDAVRGTNSMPADRTWRSRLVVGLGLLAGPITLFLSVTRIGLQAGPDPIAWLILAASAAFLAVPLVERSWPGGPAATLFVLVPTVALVGMAALEAGVDSEAVLWMPIVPLAAVALVGLRGGALAAGIIVGALVGLSALHGRGAFPADPMSPQVALKAVAAVTAVFFGFALGLVYELNRRHHLGSLAAAEARNRALLDAMPDAVLRLDRSGRILDAVPSPDVRGFQDAESVVGHLVDDVLGADRANHVREHVGQALAKGRGRTLTLDFPEPDGIVILELRSIPLADGTCLTIVRDMSEPATPGK
jgi:PAS domain-containing protein